MDSSKHMKRGPSALLLLLVCTLFQAQNPIVPTGVYMADPTARVWDDGRLYIYGSVDESTDYYCSYRYHVLSTDNLVDWTLHENTFASRGEGDQVSYSDALLFAPDCQVKGDSFYLYYCQPDPDYPEGVATSTSPTGPFTRASAIDLGGHHQIDPCLFIDNDGQAYYMWGQFTMKMAKMNPDMRSLDLSTLNEAVINEDEHHFHEGPHMVKRNGIYYLLYAHLGRTGMPSGIGYCTSDTPMGPFTYRGVIVDNDRSDPGNWNNHGSIMEFNGQWYVFYHRASHNSKMMRRACMEPILFSEDGSIDQVEMTSQGAGPPLKATDWMPAERACLLHGQVRAELVGKGDEALTKLLNEDKFVYKYLDFEEGCDSLRLRIRPGQAGGTLRFTADKPWGPALGRVDFEGKADEDTWISLTVPVRKEVSGIRALWVQYWGEGEGVALDGFEFSTN